MFFDGGTPLQSAVAHRTRLLRVRAKTFEVAHTRTQFRCRLFLYCWSVPCDNLGQLRVLFPSCARAREHDMAGWRRCTCPRWLSRTSAPFSVLAMVANCFTFESGTTFTPPTTFIGVDRLEFLRNRNLFPA